MYIPHLLHSFISRHLSYFCSLAIVTNASLVRKYNFEHWCANITLRYWFHFCLIYIHRSGIGRSCGSSILIFWGVSTLFSIVATLLYIPINSAQRGPISVHPCQHLLLLFDFVLAFIVIYLFLTVVILICEVISNAVYVSPMISGVENHFMCLLAICVPSLENVCPSFAQYVCLFVCFMFVWLLLSLWALYIFYILTPVMNLSINVCQVEHRAPDSELLSHHRLQEELKWRGLLVEEIPGRLFRITHSVRPCGEVKAQHRQRSGAWAHTFVSIHNGVLGSSWMKAELLNLNKKSMVLANLMRGHWRDLQGEGARRQRNFPTRAVREVLSGT